jgi:beta-barrel assembly-enhancing protease
MVLGPLAAALGFLALLSCSTTSISPVETEGGFRLEDDEKRLWSNSQEEERRLDSSKALYTDAFWVGYVNEVAQRLIPPEAKSKGLQIEIRIIKNPLLNAFTYPNGVIYVHTGLLARMENEAQLATLLGHEMTHALHRHAIQNLRSVKNTTAALAGFQVLTLPLGPVGSLIGLMGTVGATAAVTGYSRDLERDADANGLELMARAGYEPSESPKLFVHLKQDVEEQKVNEPFFFGTHPRLQERIDNYSALLEETYRDKKGDTGSTRFRQKLVVLILDNAHLDLSMGRFSSAERGLTRALGQEPENAKGHYYLGELYRQRGQDGDRQKAEVEYLFAVKHDADYAAPHRGLGLLAYKQGLNEKANMELSRYLALDPAAEDRKYIEQYIQDLASRGQP